MDFLSNYGLYLAKIITMVAAILIVITAIASLMMKEKDRSKNKISIKKLNEKYDDLKKGLKAKTLSKAEFKKFIKSLKKAAKDEKRADSKRKIYVLNFIGDIKANAVHALREEITAILTVATPEDEIVINLESPGGLVHGYGLAASQLQRIKERNIPLTVIVDKVAASGGYLMACVADKILAAPFSIIGSIGVVAQMPNFHKFLKKHNIDFEQVTAGEYKRTLTVFGENTDKDRKKFKADLEEIHGLFKDFLAEHRPTVNLEEVATGEHWLAKRAKELNLVDDLITSDDYLLNASEKNDLYEVTFLTKKTLSEKLSSTVEKMFMH